MDSLILGYKQAWFMSYNMIFDMKISAHSKLVYIYLCRCAGEKASSFPSKRNIGQACSISATSVYMATKELMEAGLLTKEARYRKDNARTSNLYVIYDRPKK